MNVPPPSSLSALAPLLPGAPRPAAPGIAAPMPLAPAAAGADHGPRAPLDFSDWERTAAPASVLGDLPYPGNAADAGAVAEAIAALLFDRG